jgi:hypothetical protein
MIFNFAIAQSVKQDLDLQSENTSQHGFQTHLIAFREQASTQGVFSVSGLHGWHVYLIFFRCSSATAATVLSSKSIICVSISKAF